MLMICSKSELNNREKTKRTKILKHLMAFTLAEVLITLAIIGIVAAMTIPTIIQNYQIKTLQSQFNRAYSDLNQASKLFELHNDMTVSQYTYVNGSTRALKAFKNEFSSTLNASSLIYSSTDEDGNTIGASPYKWKGITGNSERGSTCNVSGFFWDAQNRVISFDDAPKSTGVNGPKVCIDINGENSPNRYGIDYFVFVFTTDGYVIPYGQEHKNNSTLISLDYGGSVDKEDYCKYSTNGDYQITCANYALINQHPTDDTKDYWHDFVRGR